MELKRVSIHKIESWENSGEGYKGTAQFTSSRGEIAINLDSTVSIHILKILADELVLAARHVASDMTRDIIETNTTLKLE